MRRTSRVIKWHRHGGESGLALMTALVVALIVALITAGLFSLALTEYSTATTLDRSTQAFLATEAGGERAIAYLRTVADWSSLASTDTWTPVTEYTDAAFPDPSSGAPKTGSYTVALRHLTGYDPATHIRVRIVGRSAGGKATRTIEFTLSRVTGVDMALYSVSTFNLKDSGGSVQIHGSAYFESDLIFGKGGAELGFYNDRLVSSADVNPVDGSPQYLNHLYVNKNLDFGPSNPTIGKPYHFVHIGGSKLNSSTKYDVVNEDTVVPPPFYPKVVMEVQNAFADSANALEVEGSEMRFVVCERKGDGTWQRVRAAHLVLSAKTFFILRKGLTSCPADTSPPSAIAASQYALMWNPQEPSENLIFPNPSLDKMIYIPGQVRVQENVRFKFKGTIAVANSVGATDTTGIVPLSTCAVDLNGNGLCGGKDPKDKTKYEGKWIRAVTSPCLGKPGPNSTDNKDTLFPKRDVLGFIVNGRMYSELISTECGQEMNLAAIVGDKSPDAANACFYAEKKLQVYGVLMTRCLGLTNVPDFWQMPDMISYLPEPLKSIMIGSGNPLTIRNWKELIY